MALKLYIFCTKLPFKVYNNVSKHFPVNFLPQRLLLCSFFTAYETVKFKIEFPWTKTLQNHNQNGSLNDFLQQQFESEVRRGVKETGIFVKI